jgi:hypothetical protein
VIIEPIEDARYQIKNATGMSITGLNIGIAATYTLTKEELD